MDEFGIVELLSQPLSDEDAAAITAGLRSGVFDYAWLVALIVGESCEMVRERLERLTAITQTARVSCENDALRKYYECFTDTVHSLWLAYPHTFAFTRQEVDAVVASSPADVVAAAQALASLLGGLDDQTAGCALSNVTDLAVAVALCALYPGAWTSPVLAKGTRLGKLCGFAGNAVRLSELLSAECSFVAAPAA